MEQTTITVTTSTLDRFNELRADLNDNQPDCPDHNADSFVNALLDTWEQYQGPDETDPESEVEIEADMQLVLAALEDIKSGVNTTEQRTNSIENMVEDMGGR